MTPFVHIVHSDIHVQNTIESFIRECILKTYSLFYFQISQLSCISRAKNAEKGRAGPMMRSDNFFSGVVVSIVFYIDLYGK